jgi:hypothetical protein
MAPWADITFHDICARIVLRGGVLYQEVLGHGPPGMVLCQSAIRSLVGWRSESLRAVDFLIVSAIIYLLVSIPSGDFTPALSAQGEAARAKTSTSRRLWTAVLLYLCYFATSEWCHCQADTWMLLPSLAALGLRRRQAHELTAASARLDRLAARGFLEGICWATALVIKPFVALPALGCWLLSTAAALRTGQGRAGRLAADAGGLMAGGTVAGGITMAWLWASGNWPFFLDGVFGDWNRDYYRHSAPWGQRTGTMLTFLVPWSLIHLAAVPMAVLTVVRTLRNKEPLGDGRGLLSALYLGWLFQANFFQRQFDYQLVPPILLALALISVQFPVVARRRHLSGALVRYLVLPVVVAWPILVHPLFRYHRLALWGRCWREGSSAELRDLLSLETGRKVNPGWRELERVETFLRDQGLRDRELTCYSTSSLPLYLQLGLRPSTRYILLEADVILFPDHHDDIRRALAASPERYVISDRREMEVAPPGARLFPYSEPTVFESGRYRVHRVESVGELPRSAPPPP